MPIFKKGNKHEVGNYRPVSLTPIVSKVLESLVKRAIMAHLLSQGLISEHQYGFVPGRSCETQLLSCTNMWTKLLERGDSVDVIYTDFRKAFDAVPHQRLLVKLKAYGLGKQIMNWLEAFLSDRKQCVSINGVKLTCSPVRFPQPWLRKEGNLWRTETRQLLRDAGIGYGPELRHWIKSWYSASAWKIIKTMTRQYETTTLCM